jgi:hypothetical protein
MLSVIVKCTFAYESVIVLNKVIDNSNDINKYIIFQTKLSHHVSCIYIWYHDIVADRGRKSSRVNLRDL